MCPRSSQGPSHHTREFNWSCPGKTGTYCFNSKRAYESGWVRNQVSFRITDWGTTSRALKGVNSDNMALKQRHEGYEMATSDNALLEISDSETYI